ncbi:DUF5915 domain-containing protein [Streptomyces sp. NPDC091219]|uniref:DUF5915 domain-containing protein n=1 Tax=Streptomyces sp. NPDC091219 TaxID=3155193 RepID=UPI00344C815B
MSGVSLGEAAVVIDDLSNWYIRRSRRRFWDGDTDALATLYECLDIVTRLLAPFVPFITEEVWQQVIRRGDGAVPESVHLTTWPLPDAGLMDRDLFTEVAMARALAETGWAARTSASVRIRQPLRRALVGLLAGAKPPQALLDDVSDELNVKLLEPLGRGDEVIDVQVKPNFRALGRRFGKQTQHIVKVITATDPQRMVHTIRELGTFPLDVGGEEIAVCAEDILVTEVPCTGWVVESQRGATIALDTEITPELEAEGTARPGRDSGHPASPPRG